MPFSVHRGTPFRVLLALIGRLQFGMRLLHALPNGAKLCLDPAQFLGLSPQPGDLFQSIISDRHDRTPSFPQCCLPLIVAVEFTGILMTNVEPSPGVLVTRISPPSRSM